MYVQYVPPLLVLPVWSCDIFLEVDEVEFVQSGFAHREEQQVEGEDRVVSAELLIFLLFPRQAIGLKLLLVFWGFFCLMFILVPSDGVGFNVFMRNVQMNLSLWDVT